MMSTRTRHPLWSILNAFAVLPATRAGGHGGFDPDSISKAERFNRTLLTEWAYSRSWTYNHQRTQALDSFLRRYNTRRGHSALGGRPPISRLAA